MIFLTDYPTGNVAFLFSDIAGSTRRFEANEPSARKLLEIHDHLLSSAITQNGGTVFKTLGDSFLSAFPSAIQALLATIDSQFAIENYDWMSADIEPPAVRMALHIGDVQFRNNDYIGTALAVADRILKLAHVKQILISESFFL